MLRARRYQGLIAATAALWAVGSQSSGAPPMPDYHITRTVALGAPDRWDYVVFDAPSGRVYVAHGDRVSVVDGSTGSIVGQVEGYPGGTHGIALDHALGLGFTDDGRAGQAGAFDLKTFKTLDRISADKDADSLVFDPVSQHVFVINGDSGTITVIDPKLALVVASIQGAGKLETALAGGDGKLYVNGAQNSEILRVDTTFNRIDARWPIAGCSRPHGIAIDAAARRLFSSCANNVLVVVNLDSGITVATLPIGSGTDSAAFDPKRKLIFSANGRDGTLSIIQELDPQTFVSLGTLKTAVTARTMAIDPGSGRIYLAAGDVDPTAGSDTHAIVPGSLKLLFVDPAPMSVASGH
jgi:DNA-binding beta-propeller fold protein YncE